ncbi:DUF3500 domain-containing protein [Planctomicrobium piriforme]|uniref:Tat (Twin-arginine translocation) pathway signal sequence n=1 Tax=Planctomicrobium piriforme TaxID=1576369 RepID=A0A1I3RR56_9PLAN|nr:DUF3500 domain-containing protein [Planctomicrobium piriforme]SFJ47666.1 Tat (twin-arginine translocation) pathway signal sequence [Planctomicrobium piriforme]
MRRPVRSKCEMCDSDVTRRHFLQQIGSAAAAVGTLSLGVPFAGAYAAPSRSSQAETAAQKLYETLSPTQRAQICLPFDHPLRLKINANWAVTQPAIHESFYNKEQQALIAEVFKGITSEQGHARFLEQMEYDDGGFDRYHVALFGEPQSGNFEWMLTGRHATLRADGDCIAGAAFGGPIVYGHGEETAKDNIFYYQTQQANEVFKALDANQARKALLTKAPAETQVQLQGEQGRFNGLPVAEMSADQQALLSGVIRTLLAPYRDEDVQEAMSCIDAAGGMPSLAMAFYQQEDLNNDREWDIWRIEGPTFVCHFRGAPHVHAYLNIGTQKLSKSHKTS